MSDEIKPPYPWPKVEKKISALEFCKDLLEYATTEHLQRLREEISKELERRKNLEKSANQS